MQPMNYIIVSTSFQLILLSVFILYLLFCTLAVDSGYSPFSNSYFDTPCQTVVLEQKSVAFYLSLNK